MRVQWLGLGVFTACTLGLIPGWGNKILQAVQCGRQNKTKKQEAACLFNKPWLTVAIKVARRREKAELKT